MFKTDDVSTAFEQMGGIQLLNGIPADSTVHFAQLTSASPPEEEDPVE